MPMCRGWSWAPTTRCGAAAPPADRRRLAGGIARGPLDRWAPILDRLPAAEAPAATPGPPRRPHAEARATGS
jgi:hypothetical protein